MRWIRALAHLHEKPHSPRRLIDLARELSDNTADIPRAASIARGNLHEAFLRAAVGMPLPSVDAIRKDVFVVVGAIAATLATPDSVSFVPCLAEDLDSAVLRIPRPLLPESVAVATGYMAKAINDVTPGDVTIMRSGDAKFSPLAPGDPLVPGSVYTLHLRSSRPSLRRPRRSRTARHTPYAKK